MSDRRSYSGLMRLPAYGLYSAQGELVATVRASSAEDARAIFRRHRLSGVVVRPMAQRLTRSTRAL